VGKLFNARARSEQIEGQVLYSSALNRSADRCVDQVQWGA
jgi:hypothetical protein